MNWFSLTPAHTERFNWSSEGCIAVSSRPCLPSGRVRWCTWLTRRFGCMILTFLLLGLADRAKWLVSLSTHSRTHTDWGLSRSFKLHQTHGMYRTVVRGRSPSCSPQELSNGVRGDVGCKSCVEFNFVSYRLCKTGTERETPINVYRFFQFFFFFWQGIGTR